MMMMMMMMVWMKMVTMVMNVFVHANALFITSSSGEAWMLFFMKAQSSTVGTIVHIAKGNTYGALNTILPHQIAIYALL